ncbi:sugar porter family MFS transporter [Rhodocytophaga rosea]|uniref:Sugar porter family MFS transporter n=1 Tax=Rhodocytophaga rosea TaxID=2704465 RepID=A0A6C0GUE8_9BACT|nr:sugar porter family MFS transporter [Rhodocytophaga rosea]QHT71477.1 sugar porter family MFS transporter [Rhodocytophaga rosea]
MNGKTFRCVLIVSFAGFLFGFDSVLISGANLPIKHLWDISDWFHGTFIISISLWGTVLGALFGGYPTENLGRKVTLIAVGVMFTISALGTALAISPYMFSCFRFIGGLAAGIGSIAAPSYISETSHATHRGKLGMLFQLNIVTGILLAYLSNYTFTGIDSADSDWRWMLGIMVVPAFLYTLLLFTIDESPRWLMLKRKDEALKNLDLVKNEDSTLANAGLFSGKYTKALVLSFLIAFFNQFSGISFILFYAPEILEKAGYGTAQSLLSAVSIGVVNLVFTLVGISLIDRIGRKKLMYVGSVGYIISLTMVACGFYYGLPAGFTLIFVLLFIVSHAVGQGAVIWVFIAEIFPTQIRAFGQAWGSGLLNSFAAMITLFGAVFINEFAPWIIFASFALLMVLQLLFTAFIMPETKGVSLEELETKLISS